MTATAHRRGRATIPKSRPTGVVRAIVAVTGCQDEVNDIIHPGIFAPALKKRWPKVVFHHDFRDFVGGVRHMEEWLPGDPRLPKKQPNGLAWPKEAGALVATMQFNMRTERGRTVYEWARFYAETGEASWSIGYKVPPGADAKRGGIRYIYGIDLFEVSLVLHGAHPMTMALEVKSAAAATAVGQARSDLEFKTATAGALPQQPDNSDGIMVALYPDQATAKSLAVEGGEPVDELHVTLAYLGRTGDVSFTADDVVAAVRGAVAEHQPLSGSVGGLGVFPAGDDGTPVWAPVDVPGLETLRENIVRSLDEGPTAGAVARNHGYTPHLTLGYDLPSIKPAAPHQVRFGEAFVVFGDQRTPVPFGARTSAGPDVPPIETKAAAAAVANARTHPAMEAKSMIRMNGSHEERSTALDRALTKKFVKRKKHDDDGSGGVPDYCSWVNREATFDDHVVVSVHQDEHSDKRERAFTVTYTWDGEDITLGEPIEVELGVVPAAGAPVAPPTGVERILIPAMAGIAETAAAITALPMERKTLAMLRPAMLDLIDALALKGMDVAGLVLGEDEELDENGNPIPPATPEANPVDELTPEDLDYDSDEEAALELEAAAGEGAAVGDGATDAPAADPAPPEAEEQDGLSDADDDDDSDDSDDERVYLDPAQLEAELAEMRA